jgi:Ser/Thr protein kinase RdoA (MazF antagonist)
MKAPDFSHASILATLTKRYGLGGGLQALVSERDQNLLLDADDGRRYAVKIASAAEAPEVAIFQARVLQHVAMAGVDAETPALVQTIDGELLTSIGEPGSSHILRVASWVEGATIPRDSMTPGLAASLGRALAGLDRALSGFEEPGKSQQTPWDMQCALTLRDIGDTISDELARQHVFEVLDEFERQALPAFEQMRRQVIHNDANPDNVIADIDREAVTGFIDFSDLVEAPLVVELAVAASYLRDTGEPWSLLRPFVDAYNEVIPLRSDELELLPLLVETRLATTITMRYWRASQQGADDAYAQRARATEGDAESYLYVLRDGGADQPLL